MMSNILLVTGASSDVGVALIKRVAVNYDKIVCHYRNSAKLIEELQLQFGSKIIPICADFSDDAAAGAFTAKVLEAGLAPAHFVHLCSSSGSINVKFNKTGWKQFENEMKIALRSAVMCCQAFVPLMAKAKHGKVIFMLSSQMAQEPLKPYSTAYTCTKYALYGLMKSLSAEYCNKGIMVNGVSPSMIDTKFLQVPDIVKQAHIDESPLKRLLGVDDIAPVFEFLLSPGADAITGQNIPVMGGN